MKPYFLPLISCISAGAAAHRWASFPKLDDVSVALSFGGSVASISATMLGFMLAALAVLASINHTHLIKMMREYGHYADLVQTMVVGSLFFLLCTLSGFFFLFGGVPDALKLSVLVGLHVGALVCLIDIGRKFWMMLTHLSSS